MRIQPIQPNKPSFGIYISTKQTPYGECVYGNYRGYNIEIYNATKDKAKLYYVSDIYRNWIKSKLIYIQDGIKKILKSQRR